MKLTTCILFLLAVYQVDAQYQSKEFTPLNALVGNWSMETKKGMIHESWIKVDDSTLRSKSFRLNGTDTVLLEEVDLVMRLGNIYYMPIVQGQNNHQPVLFKLSKLENGIYTFENPEHDFPQRVIYELPKENKLHAWIEGTSKGTFKKSDYFFTREN